MEASFSLTAVLGLAAIALVALIELAYLVRRRRKGQRPKVEPPRRERQLILRPPAASPALPISSPAQAEGAEAVRFVILFTDMVKRMSAAQVASDVPSVLVRTISDLIGTPSVAYFEYDETRNALRLTEGRGLRAGLTGQLTFPLGEGKIGYAAQKGMVMEGRDFDYEGPDERQRIQSIPSGGAPTDYCAPMIHQGQLFGLVAVAQPRYAPPHLKKLLSAMADLAANSLHNARLLGRFAQQADTDGLTGLFSRRYFTWRLAEEVVRCQNYGDPLSLIMLDVDHFKHYNDTNGHPAGDAVLRRVADALRKNFRKTDIVARYGGEEFSVVMSGLKKDQAVALAQRLREHIEGQEFPHGEKQPLGHVTISAGVASFPQDATTGEELVLSADQALYQAKQAGRNRVVQYQAGDLSEGGQPLDPEEFTGRSAALEEFLGQKADAAPAPPDGQPAPTVPSDRRAPGPIPPDPKADPHWVP